MAYRNILVTLDGSKLSEMALQHAIQVAAPDAHIHILSVIAEGPTDEVASLANARAYQVPGQSEQWPYTSEKRDVHQADARQKYLREVSEWLEPAGYQVSLETETGNVIDTIIAVAQRGFDAIVIATHGHTGANKMVLGSVAEAVLRRAPCPVVVIPANNISQTKTNQ
jgi:nucleotide-binding universal stress UspA family protein